jgi:polyphosphate kinase 2
MEFHALEHHPEFLKLQTELVWLQQDFNRLGKRLIIIFEGRDSAGKGGGIMRFTRYLNPRFYKVVALNKPTEIELGQWYFERYIKHLPEPGNIAFFDRSWYNRAVVEPVMGFCTQQQYEIFMQEVNWLENAWIRDGMFIIKFWFSIDVDVQKKRLDKRRREPLFQWKMSSVDAVAQQKWKKYTHYKQEMFKNTSSTDAPWVVVNGNIKDNARIEAIRYVVSLFDYDKKGESGTTFEVNPEIISVISNQDSAEKFIAHSRSEYNKN